MSASVALEKNLTISIDNALKYSLDRILETYNESEWYNKNVPTTAVFATAFIDRFKDKINFPSSYFGNVLYDGDKITDLCGKKLCAYLNNEFTFFDITYDTKYLEILKLGLPKAENKLIAISAELAHELKLDLSNPEEKFVARIIALAFGEYLIMKQAQIKDFEHHSSEMRNQAELLRLTDEYWKWNGGSPQPK